MDGSAQWLFPSTHAAAAIRYRPLALAIFYRCNIDPWSEPEKSLAELCAENNVNIVTFINELEELPSLLELTTPMTPTRWREQPCFYLIDYLTEEHRSFLHGDIPAIRYLLDMGFPDVEGNEQLFRSMVHGIEEFSHRLQMHIREEEEEIFPFILHSEYLLHHSSSARRLNKNPAAPLSNKILFAARLLHNEEDFKVGLDGFLERAGLPIMSASQTFFNLGLLMRSLAGKLLAHSRLETDVLFPMASRLERELQDLSHAST